MSDVKSIGSDLVAMCREGKNLEAIEKYYGDDIVSVEAMEGPGHPREIKGKQEVLGKTKWWIENHEIHKSEAKGPFPHGDDKFAVIFDIDVTMKQSGQRMQMEEVGVYHVSGGKIVREEFFYGM